MLTADQLRMARAALRLTVKALADLAGVDKGTIVRIEAGEKSYKRTLKDLREALEQRGVVFLDAVDGAHRPGVALSWASISEEDGDTANDATSESGEGLNAQAWDDGFEDATPAAPADPDFPPLEITEEDREDIREMLRTVEISPAGRAVLERDFGL